jgi:hypothetical protein
MRVESTSLPVVVRVGGERQVKALDHDQPAHAVPVHRGEDGGGALL